LFRRFLKFIPTGFLSSLISTTPNCTLQSFQRILFVNLKNNENFTKILGNNFSKYKSNQLMGYLI